MGDRREKKNEFPFLVDVAKYFIDQFGMDIGASILNLIVPEKAKPWLKDALSGAKGEALLGSIAVGAARLIPDSPFGVVLEEAIRELVASLRNFISGKTPEASVENMPADLQEKIEAVRQSAELDYGLLSIPAENAGAIAAWLSYLKKEKGKKIASKALLMLNRLPSGYLETFSWFNLEEKNAYFEAFSFEEKKKPLPLPPPEGPSWIERQRAEMDKVIQAIGEDRDRLRNKKVERRERLRIVWQEAIHGKRK